MSFTADPEICNLALGHIGVTREIADVDERSVEAKACRRFYPDTLRNVLRDFVWPFATNIEALGLVEAEPNDEWDFAYRYPTDCLKFRRILSGQRVDTQESRIKYRIIRDDSGLLILTDKEDAEGEYTLAEDDPTVYPPDFKMAASLRLASYIAPSLTAGDPFKMGEKAMRNYLIQVSMSEANSANEGEPDLPPESESMRARE